MPTIEIKKTILMPTKKVMSLVVTATVKRSNPSPNPNCKNGQNQNSGTMTTMMTSFLQLALRVTPKVNTFLDSHAFPSFLDLFMLLIIPKY